MAVRDDFAAGEVLAAADLNDTFASKLPYSYGTATPSTTDSGFLWYDSNSTPAAPKFWNGSAFVDFPSGMSLVTAETFSAVSSISINGCFTSAYDNYRLIIRVNSATNNSTVTFRMRASGSDNTASNYSTQRFGIAGTSSSATRAATGNTSILFDSSSTNPTSVVCDVFAPQDAAHTQFVTQSTPSYSDLGEINLYASIHSVASAFDGITLLVTTGTITGNLRIYGYKD